MKNLLMAALVAALSLAAHSANAGPVHSCASVICFVVTITVDATNNNGDRDPATPGLQVDEGDIVTITARFQWEGMRYPTDGSNISWLGVNPGGTARYSPPYQDYRVRDGRGIGGGYVSIYDRAVNIFLHIVDDSIAEPDETIIHPTTGVTTWCFSEVDEFGRPIFTKRIYCDGSEFTIVYGDPVTITIRQNEATATPVTPDPVADNSTAREESPLTAPTAAIARGVGMLAANAVTKRLHTTATANQLNIGRATTAEELLRRSDFNLAGGGFNFWGGGSYVSVDGDHDGVDYDGDTSAFTLGIDTNWRDGLIGVAVSRSDSDVDITVTVPVPAVRLIPSGPIIFDIIKGKQETEVTSVHPYLTRRFGKSQLWLTAGHGSGDAEVKDRDAVIKTDITVTTAALGLRRAHGQLTGNISALYSRAEMDEATNDRGITLLAVAADSLRVAAAGQAHWIRGAWSPFVDFTVRHDSGDGDTGIAGDLGGGIEYRAPTVVVRLTTATTIAAESAEENRASLTVRKSSGDFDLGLNLDADGTGIDTARLLTGEWRF